MTVVVGVIVTLTSTGRRRKQKSAICKTFLIRLIFQTSWLEVIILSAQADLVECLNLWPWWSWLRSGVLRYLATTCAGIPPEEEGGG